MPHQVCYMSRINYHSYPPHYPLPSFIAATLQFHLLSEVSTKYWSFVASSAITRVIGSETFSLKGSRQVRHSLFSKEHIIMATNRTEANKAMLDEASETQNKTKEAVSRIQKQALESENLANLTLEELTAQGLQMVKPETNRISSSTI